MTPEVPPFSLGAIWKGIPVFIQKANETGMTSYHLPSDANPASIWREAKGRTFDTSDPSTPLLCKESSQKL